MQALIYCRVSTDAQERDGTSLETQEQACIQYARSNGLHVTECIRDAASGFTLDRPGIERIRQMVRNRDVSTVVAFAVDCLSRNQNHIGVLFDEAEQAGVRLEFVTENFEDTAVGRFILAARAFSAEVEREKIMERTMRGKAARARSGRIPQATGKGIYGYIYNRGTGRREVDPVQGPVVRRIFSEFAHGASVLAIANRLNEEGIPTFAGGHWYPATVYHLLRNQTYTGRTVYRRTIATRIRDPRTGQKHRKVGLRDPGEWIEIADATPQLVDENLFRDVQARLDDPERLRTGRRIHEYRLSGRVRCIRCGRAMVGQTLSKSYHYYRCRRAFAGPKHDRCDAQYVRADRLERAVKDEIALVLASPERILAEWQRLQADSSFDAEQNEIRRRIASLDGQKQRLIKLYQLGEVDDAYLESESKALKANRTVLEAKLQRQDANVLEFSAEDLTKSCQRIREWIADAEGDDADLLLEALQVQISAEKDRGEIRGIIPDYAPTNKHADVRLFNDN